MKSQHFSLLPPKLYGKILLSLFLVSTFIPVASGGGFQLSDHSITSLGRAHAGYGVVGDDASSAHFNPAGMSLLKKQQLQGGFAYNDASAPIENTNSTGINSGENDDGAQASVVPNSYFIMPFNQKINFGLGITAPFGTHSDYDDDFFGRYNGLETELRAVDINPSMSYEINEKFSIGAGFSIQTLDVTLSRALFTGAADGKVNLEGDSVDYGYNFGLMFQITPNSRFGVGYRSAIEHDIEGHAEFSGIGAGDGTFAADSAFESPATAYFGYHQSVSSTLSFSLGARWTEWSSFEEIRVSFPDGNNIGGADDVTDINWDDSWTFMAGLDGKLSDKLGWRAGVAIDETPVPDETRSVRTIDSDRTWYTIGLGYQISGKTKLDFAYRYIEFDDAPISQTTFAGVPPSAAGTVNGEMSSASVHTFAMQFNYSF